jgi:hypothetical protein
MSALAIVLIVFAALTLVFLIGGIVIARRRVESPDWDEHIRRADQALEQARAADRGWDRELIHAAARSALGDHRPGFEPDSMDLVLVDDRPGVEEDRAHLIAARPGETVRLVLARDASGAWGVERVE